MTEAIPVALIGMNADLMCRYIEFVADRLLVSFGYAPFYGTANPFEWMDLISLQGKSNFFEVRVGEYAKASVSSTMGAASTTEDKTFRTDAEF